METRFHDFQTLANFQACIDKSYSTSSRHTLSPKDKEEIKKNLLLIETTLKEKNYAQVKIQLIELSQFLDSVIRKVTSHGMSEDKTVLDSLVEYRNHVLNHITNHLLERTLAVLPQEEKIIAKGTLKKGKQRVSDPLRKISEDYKKLDVGKSLYFKSVRLHGLSVAEGEKLFDYLRREGYAIKTKKETSEYGIWKGRIKITKNAKPSLDFPLHYNGILTDFCAQDLIIHSRLVVQYTPNLTLLKFPSVEKALSCKRFNDILNTHQTTASILKFLHLKNTAIRNFRALSEKPFVTEMDIQNALRPCSPHRFNLFVRESEKPDTSSATDRIIYAYKEAFRFLK